VTVDVVDPELDFVLLLEEVYDEVPVLVFELLDEPVIVEELD
jgi:hypothetical protein